MRIHCTTETIHECECDDRTPTFPLMISLMENWRYSSLRSLVMLILLSSHTTIETRRNLSSQHPSLTLSLCSHSAAMGSYPKYNDGDFGKCSVMSTLTLAPIFTDVTYFHQNALQNKNCGSDPVSPLPSSKEAEQIYSSISN